jgi:hypothetical protein
MYPQHFKTYAMRANARPVCAITQAVRAMTVALTSVTPINITVTCGHTLTEFVDGSLHVYYLVREVLAKACLVFSCTARLECLVSLGTGYASAICLAHANDAFQIILLAGLIETLAKVITNCKAEVQCMACQYVGRQADENHYLWLSITHGAGGIALEKWDLWTK